MLGDNMEKRTFVEDSDKERIIQFLEENSVKKETEKQAIYFYHTETDFRIIRTKNYIKMNLKPDNLDESEKIVFISPKYDSDIFGIFYNLGTAIEFKRYRIRHKYIYQNLYVTIDENIKFGNVLRVRTEKEENIDKFYETINIIPTSMELFEERYAKYRIEWANLIKDINEEEFIK